MNSVMGSLYDNMRSCQMVVDSDATASDTDKEEEQVYIKKKDQNVKNFDAAQFYYEKQIAKVASNIENYDIHMKSLEQSAIQIEEELMDTEQKRGSLRFKSDKKDDEFPKCLNGSARTRELNIEELKKRKVIQLDAKNLDISSDINDTVVVDDDVSTNSIKELSLAQRAVFLDHTYAGSGSFSDITKGNFLEAVMHSNTLSNLSITDRMKESSGSSLSSRKSVKKPMPKYLPNRLLKNKSKFNINNRKILQKNVKKTVKKTTQKCSLTFRSNGGSRFVFKGDTSLNNFRKTMSNRQTQIETSDVNVPPNSKNNFIQQELSNDIPKNAQEPVFPTIQQEIFTEDCVSEVNAALENELAPVITTIKQEIPTENCVSEQYVTYGTLLNISQTVFPTISTFMPKTSTVIAATSVPENQFVVTPTNDLVLQQQQQQQI